MTTLRPSVGPFLRLTLVRQDLENNKVFWLALYTKFAKDLLCDDLCVVTVIDLQQTQVTGQMLV